MRDDMDKSEPPGEGPVDQHRKMWRPESAGHLDILLERFLNPLPEDFSAACAEWRGLNEESETYAKGYARIIVKRMIDAYVESLRGKGCCFAGVVGHVCNVAPHNDLRRHTLPWDDTRDQ